MLNKEKPVEVTINTQKCVNCGLCAQACPAEYLLFDGKIHVNDDAFLGCVQCGHCMMACPHDAITIKGEGISPEDIFPLDGNHAGYDSLYSLLAKRRSIRKYKNEPVSKEMIEKILRAASTGAISIPPYEVKVLVINGKEKVQEFAADIVNSIKKTLKFMNSFTLQLFKPFIGENNYRMFNEFILPLMKITVDEREKGKDVLFYDAPVVVLFYTTPFSDKEDAIIASTLAENAANSLGLGTCVIGTVPPVINKNDKLKAKYGLFKEETVQLAFILGHPEKRFSKGIKRQFKEVNYY